MGAPETDSLAQFAADLRALRSAAGDPILEALARECGVGRTALSNTFRGQSLPTKKTVVAIVSTLGGDPDAWGRRWARLRLASLARTSSENVSASAKWRAHASAFARRWWKTAAVALSCLAIGFACGLAVNPTEAQPPLVVVTTGDDPWSITECRNDANRVIFGTRADHYLVEVFYSKTCEAVWGQITRFDGHRDGNRLTAKTYRQFEPASAQTVTNVDVQTVRTPLVVPDDRLQPICVSGTAQLGEEEIELTPPVCSDSR